MAAYKFVKDNAGSADINLVKELQKFSDALEVRLAALEATSAALATTYMTRTGSNANLGTDNVVAPAIYNNAGVVTVGTA